MPLEGKKIMRIPQEVVAAVTDLDTMPEADREIALDEIAEVYGAIMDGNLSVGTTTHEFLSHDGLDLVLVCSISQHHVRVQAVDVIDGYSVEDPVDVFIGDLATNVLTDTMAERLDLIGRRRRHIETRDRLHGIDQSRQLMASLGIFGSAA